MFYCNEVGDPMKKRLKQWTISDEKCNVIVCKCIGWIHYWAKNSGGALPLIFCIHVRLGPIYWGIIYLAKRIIRWWYITCKEPENIICDVILHVDIFHNFKIPYITRTFFTKFTYNKYIGPCIFCRMLFLIFLLVIPPHAKNKQNGQIWATNLRFFRVELLMCVY